MRLGWGKNALVGALVLLLLAGLVLSGCSKDKATNTTSTVESPVQVQVPTWDQLVATKDSKAPATAEISGRYTGVMVFTEVIVPQPQGKTTEDQAGEACGYAMLAALKDAPLPTVIDLQVGADGKGTLKMNIQGLTDKEGSSPEATPISYANGKISFDKMESDPNTITSQEVTVSFLNKEYKQGLSAKAGDEKIKGKALQDEIAQLKAKLASAPENEKASLQSQIQQKESIAKMRDTSSLYMEQLSSANATLVLNGSFSSQSKDGQTAIKGILTAINATVNLPQK